MTKARRDRLRAIENQAREVWARPNTSLNEALLAEALIQIVVEVVNSVEVDPEVRKLGPWAVSGGGDQ